MFDSPQASLLRLKHSVPQRGVHSRNLNKEIATEVWERNIIDVHGETGREWLKKLPGLILECAQRWSLEIQDPFQELSYNYVVRGTTRDGVPVAVKAGVPGHELASEINALRAFDGKGISRLFEADLDLGVMVLELLEPGAFLSELDDDEEMVTIGISVWRKLCTPAPQQHEFIEVNEWADRSFAKFRASFDGGCGPLPRSLIDTAQNLSIELVRAQDGQKLIHGDFHPQNILSSRRDSWLAIDPKGVVGDPLYDVAVLLCEPPRQPIEIGYNHFLKRRIDQSAELLKVDQTMIAKWCLLHSVMSGLWSLNDHGDGWQSAFARAEILEPLIKQ